jgi:hypothetical protein
MVPHGAAGIGKATGAAMAAPVFVKGLRVASEHGAIKQHRTVR